MSLNNDSKNQTKAVYMNFAGKEFLNKTNLPHSTEQQINEDQEHRSPSHHSQLNNDLNLDQYSNINLQLNVNTTVNLNINGVPHSNFLNPHTNNFSSNRTDMDPTPQSTHTY